MRNSRDLILGEVVYISIIYRTQILDFIHSMVTIFSFDHMSGENGEFPRKFRIHRSLKVCLLFFVNRLCGPIAP